MLDMNLNSTEWMYVVTPQDATWSLFDEYPDRGARVRERVLEKYRRWHRLIQAVEEYAHTELREDLRRIKDEV